MNAEEHRAAAENLLGEAAIKLAEIDQRETQTGKFVQPEMFTLLQMLVQAAQVHATLATNLPADAAALSAAQGRIAQLEAEVHALRNQLDALRGERDTARAQLAGGQP